MKNSLGVIIVAAVSLGAGAAGLAAAQINLVNSPPSFPTPTANRQSVSAQLDALQAKVDAQHVAASRIGPAAYSPRAWTNILQAYDAILAEHKNERNDEIAQVALAKAMLYGEIFNQADICVEQLDQVMKDYPGTPTVKQAAVLAQKFQADAADKAARRRLIGQSLPDFQVADNQGKLLSPAGLKGKVVLLDFWGPGCAPCLSEMPHVEEIYAQYHPKGLEIVGVSNAWGFGLGGGADAKTVKTNLAAFLKAHQMPWPEYCVGVPLQLSGPHNELFAKLLVNETPANFLVGRDGKIIGMDLFGDDLDEAVAKALAVK